MIMRVEEWGLLYEVERGEWGHYYRHFVAIRTKIDNIDLGSGPQIDYNK